MFSGVTRIVEKSRHEPNLPASKPAQSPEDVSQYSEPQFAENRLSDNVF